MRKIQQSCQYLRKAGGRYRDNKESGTLERLSRSQDCDQYISLGKSELHKRQTTGSGELVGENYLEDLWLQDNPFF
jgi:hypothetical protein